MSEIKPVAWLTEAEWGRDVALSPPNFGKAEWKVPPKVSPLYTADAIEALQAECERLRAQVEVAEAGYQSAVSKAQWQASTNSELNRLIRQRNELGVECERLREELAAAREEGRQAGLEGAATLCAHRAAVQLERGNAEQNELAWARQTEATGCANAIRTLKKKP